MQKLLLFLAALFLLIVGIGFFLPTTYAVERRITIDASAERVHELVGDLEQWPSWAPWEGEDPTMQTTLGEQTTGVGASQKWTGKDGDGELTFTGSDPAAGIKYDMAFIMEGKRAPAQCAMLYESDGKSTTVVWTMSGDMGDVMPPVVGGYLGLLMPGSIGAMFDTGLGRLKELAEAAPGDDNEG